MTWTLTRTDRATGAVVSTETFPDLDALISDLRERGIPLTDAHAAEIANHPDTQFAQAEMISDGLVGGYSGSVLYDLRPTQNVPTPKPPRKYLKCRRCGAVGAAGPYPFSTLPDSGLCDDCV